MPRYYHLLTVTIGITFCGILSADESSFERFRSNTEGTRIAHFGWNENSSTPIQVDPMVVENGEDSQEKGSQTKKDAQSKSKDSDVPKKKDSDTTPKDKTIPSEKLPETVKKVLNDKFKDAKMESIKVIEVRGTNYYDIKMVQDKYPIKTQISEAGKITYLEQEIDPKKLPTKVQDLIETKYPKSSYRVVTQFLASGGASTYHVDIKLADGKFLRVDISSTLNIRGTYSLDSDPALKNSAKK
jgi:hypothetical protein